MPTDLVMMPMKLLYLNKIKLGDTLKVTNLLLRLVQEFNIQFDREKYIEEIKDVDTLLNFSNSKRLFEYIVNRYISNIKITEFCDDEENIISFKNDMFIGAHEINLETFYFFNERLWPELLTLYINRTLDKTNLENLEIDLKFQMSDLENLYFSNDIVYLVKEFISDLSLYLTYNRIGYIKLSGDEIIVSKENLGLKMEIVI